MCLCPFGHVGDKLRTGCLDKLVVLAVFMVMRVFLPSLEHDMHVCVYVCMRVCVYVRMYVCMYVCMYVSKSLSKKVSKYVSMRVCV